MRRLIPAVLAVVSVVLSVSVAVAADYPLKPRKKVRAVPPPPVYVPPPPPALPAIYDWSGWYFGSNVGGGWADIRSDFSVAGSPPFASATNRLAGLVAGGQVGFNWQTGPAVFGVETDFQYSGLRGDLDASCPAAVCGVALNASYSQKMTWLGTARGRLGYAHEMWLIYATGGYAYARLTTDAVATAGGVSASISRSEQRSGWTVGGGVEVAFSRHWTAKMEYLYVDLGDRDATLTVAGLPIISDRTRIHENLVRAGLNYRF